VIRRYVSCGLMIAGALSAAQGAIAQAVAVGAAPAESAPQSVLERPVTVELDHVSLKRAVAVIAAQANVKIAYRVEMLDASPEMVSVHAKKVPLGQVLDQVLDGRAMQVVVTGDGILALEPKANVAVMVRAVIGITGTVKNSKTKQPVAGATIVLDDAKQGVQTNDAGVYRLPATPGEHRITVRAVGYTRQVRKITVSEGGDVTADFALETSANVLDQVIVTGTVVATERKALPTPITVLTAADLEKRNITSIDELFHGEVPDVLSIESGTQGYSSNSLGQMVQSRIYTRGSASLNGSANPLKTYVDGIEIVDPSYVGTLDPKSIERIEIITGPQAATIYGSGALGGVMQVFTKRGSGTATPDVRLNAKVGFLQNSFTQSLTPTHDHSLLVTGGSGPAFSYSANGSYRYSGQWQPNLFTREFGGSLGATHNEGPFTLGATFAATLTQNGIMGFGLGAPCGSYGSFFGCFPTLLDRMGNSSGQFTPYNPVAFENNHTSSSSNQNLGFNLDYRMTNIWQHHLTLGRVQTNFEDPATPPTFQSPYDTSYSMSLSDAHRTTANYNTTLIPRFGNVAMTLTIGADGSWANAKQFYGTAPTKDASSWSDSYSSFTQTLNDNRYGGFGSAQIGIADQLFFTLALRGQHDPNYGRDYKVDWTPTEGVTYTMERGDVTLKLLASYGRATRPPSVDQRKEFYIRASYYDPAAFIAQLAAPELKPEYSRGPQGGFELYYGNRFAFTVNHYSQHIDNLIQPVPVGDSFFVAFANCNCGGFKFASHRNKNIASMRQSGWSGTSSLTLSALTFKGTYSWNDSRILSTYGPGLGYGQYQVGQGFIGVPTHTGNFMVTYGTRATSVTYALDYVGSQINGVWTTAYAYITASDRFRSAALYSGRVTGFGGEQTFAGYVKSDLNVSQRLNGWITGTLNIKNLGNNFSSDVTELYPSLGRQTLLGLSFRLPKKS